MIEVLIQATAGCRDKARYDEKALVRTGTGRVAEPYPYPYGFVLHTTAADGDNADCYVITQAPLAIGTIVECEPVALVEQIETGEIDHKILAVPVGEPAEVHESAVETLRRFMHAVFAAIPGETVEIGPCQSKDAAIAYLRTCR